MATTWRVWRTGLCSQCGWPVGVMEPEPLPAECPRCAAGAAVDLRAGEDVAAVAAFAVGDRVRCVRLPDYAPDNLSVGDTGTVRQVDDDSVPYGVEWDRDIAGGHNLRGTTTSMRGWWVKADQIAPAPAAAPEPVPTAPRTGEGVAAMMRAAWPGVEWAAADLAAVPDQPTARARVGRTELRVNIAEGRRWVGEILSWHEVIASVCGAGRVGMVSALRAEVARLLADLRALAPAGETDAAAAVRALCRSYGAESVDGPLIDLVRATVASVDRERSDARDQRDEAYAARDRYAHDAATARADVERLTRERDEAVAVAREALDGYGSALSMVLAAAGSMGREDIARDTRVDVKKITRLRARLGALAAPPAPPADPLDGLPAEVREGAQRVATRNGPTWLDCGNGWFVGWTDDASLEHPFVAIARDGVQFAHLTVRDGRIAWDEAPDGAITREGA